MRQVLTLVLVVIETAIASASASAQQALKLDSMALESITAGEYFTCALDAGGRAYCWGANFYGQLGTSQTTAVCGEISPVRGACCLSPVPVNGGLRFRQIDAGLRHACGIDMEGAAWCWGSNRNSQLGTAEQPEQCAPQSDNVYIPGPCSRHPVRVNSTEKFDEVTAGEEFSCATAIDGHNVWC